MSDVGKTSRRPPKQPVTVTLDQDVIAAVKAVAESHRGFRDRNVTFSSLVNKTLADAFLGGDSDRSIGEE